MRSGVLVLMLGVASGTARAERTCSAVWLLTAPSSRVELVGRLAAEARSAGFEPRTTSESSLQLLTAQLPGGSVCGVLSLTDLSTLTIAVFDPGGQRILTLRLASPGDDATWALKAVEWLRAEPSAYLKVAPQPPAERSKAISVLGVGRWAAGVGVGWGAQVAVGFGFAKGFGVELVATAPVVTHVSTSTASATLTEVAGSARLTWTLVASERWRLPFGVGLGARFIHAQGLSPTDRAGTAQAVSFDVDASAALRVLLWSWFGVELRITGVLSPGSVGLMLDGERVARLVFPAVHAAAGFVAHW